MVLNHCVALKISDGVAIVIVCLFLCSCFWLVGWLVGLSVCLFVLVAFARFRSSSCYVALT